MLWLVIALSFALPLVLIIACSVVLGEALVASSNWQQQQHAQAGAAGSFAFGGADASTVAASNAKSGSLGSLYVKNLPPEADKLYLYEKFAVYGAISSVKVLTDEMSGICKGVGFVNFLEQAAAMEAIRAMDGLKIGDKHLHVSLQTHRASARGSSGGGFQF